MISKLLQLVTRAFNKQLPKIRQWTSSGYAVVVLDNRGSANRGVKFESYVKVYMTIHMALQLDVVYSIFNGDHRS